jgi:hypothetical protein
MAYSYNNCKLILYNEEDGIWEPMQNRSTDYTFDILKAIRMPPNAIDRCSRFQQKTESYVYVWIYLLVPTDGGTYVRSSIR